MAIAAHYNKVSGAVGGVRQQSVGNLDIAAGKPVNVHLESMAGEVLADISALDVILFSAFIGDDDNFDRTAFAENRNCIRNSARRCAAAVPANHRIVDFERSLLDVGHYKHWPPRF